MTITTPDIGLEENQELWKISEAAKRWVLANLISIGWFSAGDPGPRPSFDLLAERGTFGRSQPVMGHADGHIVIDVAEADPTEIVRRRENLSEPYRTMLGHFRHEIAHFLFIRLSDETAFLPEFHALFGDEATDYGSALDNYYAQGPASNWRDNYITAYASSHPHEDWAETASHVLHLWDVIDSARAVGMAVQRQSPPAPREMDWLSEALDLGIALNHVNRSMGLEDLYPFVISPVVRQKLEMASRFLIRPARHSW
ncbi:putative zinc-binding metallopeptidase [Roseibium hamelinense]|nr:putative zinc-binding metallopeptidase [Roseibium hamelinense]